MGSNSRSLSFWRTACTTVAGLGGQKHALDENVEDADELAAHLSGNLSMAGTRFAEMQPREWERV